MSTPKSGILNGVPAGSGSVGSVTEINDFLRFLDAETVGGRVEEIRRCKQSANGGDKSRNDPPARGCDHYGDQIDDGTMRESAFPDDYKEYGSQRGDEAEREKYAGQLLADAVEDCCVIHCHTDGAVRQPIYDARPLFVLAPLGT